MAKRIYNLNIKRDKALYRKGYQHGYGDAIIKNMKLKIPPQCKVCELNAATHGAYCEQCLNEEIDSLDASDVQAAADNFDELIEEQKK